MSLLEKDITRKERIDKKVLEFDTGNQDSKKYKIKAIQDSAVYARESEGHLPDLYYLIIWKSYPKKENT